MNEIPFLKSKALKIKTMAVNQPIGKFYVGVVNATDVVEICTAKVRKKSDRDMLERYTGIQRTLNEKRVNEIKQYVKTWDASFPNSVILSINPNCYFFEGEDIYIKKDKKSANIIDGQHRLAGFDSEFKGRFDIILAIFPELELEEQAYLFSVINTKMTRINPSLAQDLYSFSTINTPEKLAHNMARECNTDGENPWYSKIKMLGRKEADQSDPVLSQSTFTTRIINLICDKKDSYKIRHILKINDNDRKKLKGKLDKNYPDKYILWNPYVEADDNFIYRTFTNFFSAVKQAYPEDWNDPTKILTKTTGYTALIQVFEKLYRVGFREKDLSAEYFYKYFHKVKENSLIKDFISKNYNPGNIGERQLVKDFIAAMELNE